VNRFEIVGEITGLSTFEGAAAFNYLARKGLIDLNYRAVRIIPPRRLRAIVQGAALTRTQGAIKPV
jgi:hypothetical protein